MYNKVFWGGLIAIVVLVLIFPSSASAGLTNGLFTNDLSGWTVEKGLVEYWFGAARFAPDEDEEELFLHSTLSSQLFELDEKSKTLSFYLEMETGPGETDIFTASIDETVIYTLKSSDVDEYFEDTLCFDVSDWAGQEIKLVFDLQHDYSDADTYVLLDNVVVTIPAPGALLLGCIGSFLVIFRHRAKAA